MKKAIVYLTVLLTAIGCNRTDKMDVAMNRADSIMEARQEDANRALAMLDSLKPQLDKMTKPQRMRFYMLQAKAMNKGYVEFTSDSIVKEVVDYRESYRMLAHIHNQIADLLDKQALVESELQELDMAYNYAMLAGDTIDAIDILSLKAPAYSLLNKADSAEMVIDLCMGMYREKGLSQYAAQISAYN